jgi:hypothetical protein
MWGELWIAGRCAPEGQELTGAAALWRGLTASATSRREELEETAVADRGYSRIEWTAPFLRATLAAT